MIETWILILGLFLPRLTLLIAWLNAGIPPNTTPFWGEFFMTLFVPNLLIALYCFSYDMDGWGYAHLAMFILRCLGSSSTVEKCKCRKRR